MGRFKSEENIKTNTLLTDTESCDTKSDITAHICEIYIYIHTVTILYHKTNPRLTLNTLN